MRIRWVIAVLAALALAVLTLDVPLPIFERAEAAGPAVCDANAKPANLNFTLKDVNNRPVRLADYKGKVIVLDFWATWCGPCKIEIPGFVDLQNRYGRNGLQVIGVSVDDTLDKLTPFVRQFKMNYPVLQGLDHDDVQDAFGPMWGIPTTVLITRDGRVCKKHIGMSAKDVFEREIKALL
ncbi:MAG: TlpA family protein disulfide reductase [Betaproteobacteria bacterium]